MKKRHRCAVDYKVEEDNVDPETIHSSSAELLPINQVVSSMGERKDEIEYGTYW